MVKLANLQKKKPQKLFYSVHVTGTTCFDECCFIPYDDWEALFFIKLFC